MPMSNEIKTRIALKYDTLANWEASTFTLKKGEVAIAEVPTSEGSTLQPVMFKVGDGTKTFSQLDWVSAKAADVYGWAKQSKSDFETYLKTFISDTIEDTDTKYTFTKDDAAGTLTIQATDKAGASIGEAIVFDVVSATELAAALEPYAKTADVVTNGEFTSFEETNTAAINAAKKAGDDAQSTINAYITSNDAALAGVKATAEAAVTDSDLATALEPYAKTADLPKDAEYTIVKDENSGDYAAVYHLTKDGVNVGAAINIPKDLVIKSGSVVGDEIILVLNDEAQTEIVINVGELIEYVTGGATTEITVSVDDVTHIATAVINEGSVGKNKLTTEVQASLDKADSAIQSIQLTSGTNNGTVKLTVDGAAIDNIAVTGLGSAAYTESSAYATAAQGATADATAETISGYGDIVTHNASEFAPADINTGVMSVTEGATDGTISVDGTDVAVHGLKTIATTGDIGDLTQTTGEYVLFNCGSALDIID